MPIVIRGKLPLIGAYMRAGSSRLVFIVLTVSLALGAGAQEPPKKPNPHYTDARGLDNWTQEYDVSTLKPGTYNIIARAVDSAGNIAFAAPFNLIVDPESDLPVAGIVNPLPAARVGGDLNIVGTCVDDDAVAHVDIKIDDGAWQRATGSDYWSYYLPTSGLPDGPHVIAVRGVDVNGLEGRETAVNFHLDRTKPRHTINAPAFGAIVSGRIAISGSAYDANGLVEVSYSMDAGRSWQALKNSYDKKTKTASFSLAVDTRKLPDGPAVLWLKSVDGVGSEGLAVFLFFVDNTKPELVVLSPGADEAVNGRFELRGRVYDTVGIKSLSWVYEKDSGQVELLPGNPYFSLPFVAPPKAGTATVKLRVVDVAGNESTVLVVRKVDDRADLPLVSLVQPAPAATIEGAVYVVGSARDDDGVAFIDWKLDSGAETRIETRGTFSFVIPGAASGQRVLSVRAIDIHGLAGPWVQAPFTYVGSPPSLTLRRASDSGGERDFAPGMQLSTMDGKALISGTIAAANPLVSLSYTVNGSAPVNLPFTKTAGGAAFTLPLSSSLPFGVLDLAVRAADSYGKTGTVRVPLLATDYTRPRAGPLVDFGLALEPTADSPVAISLGASTPLVGSFVTPFDGEDIKSVKLEPETKLVAVGHEGQIVSIKRSGDGETGPTMVVVETRRGHKFSAGPFIFRSDSTPPTIAINEPAFGAWLKDTAALVVKAQDADRVASVEYAINGGPWLALEPAGELYRAFLSLEGLSGPVRLDARALDAAGNAALATTAFMADSAAPGAQRILPRDGDRVSGPTLFVVRTDEARQSLERAELGENGIFKPLAAEPVIAFVADASSASLSFRLTDKAGNSSTLDLLAGLDRSAGSLEAPRALASLKSNADRLPAGIEGPQVSFAGADATGQLAWTAAILASAEGSGTPELQFADYTAHPIRVSGAATLNATFRGIAPDPKKPLAFWGFSPEQNDQALPLKKAADAWTASIKLPARPDGPTTLWFTIPDAGGGQLRTVLALDYDSTPPAIEVVAPGQSGGKAASPGPFLLVLRASDARGIVSLSYEAGSDKGDFELQPGSGDAARQFAFPAKSAATTLTIRAVDGSGNRSSTSLTVAYDAAADQSKVQFIKPVDASNLPARPPESDGGQVFIVYASDDDGIARVDLSLNGTVFQTSGPGPLFSVDAGKPAVGRHTASAIAVDSGGVPGTKTTVAFNQQGTAPTLSIAQVLVEAESGGTQTPREHPAGAPLVVDGKTAFLATIGATAGLAKVEYSFNGGEWANIAVPKPNPDGSYSARVPVPASLPYERSLLALRASDAAGASASASTSFYRVAPPRSGGAVSAEGVYLYDGRLDADGRITVSPETTVGALWYGRPIASLALDPPLAHAEVSFEATAITIRPLADGGSGNRAQTSVLRVKTIDGDSFSSVPFTLVVDSGPPAISLLQPASGMPAGKSFSLSGSASDPNGVALIEWSVDGGLNWTAIASDPARKAAGPGGPGGDFSLVLAPELPDGPIGIMVRATDTSGASAISLSAVARDTSPPRIVFESPRAEDTVNGTILISGYAEDEFSIASVEWSGDGSNWEKLESPPRGAAPAQSSRVAFSRMVDLGALNEGVASMAFRAVDASGNTVTVRPLDPAAPAFSVDILADKPTIQVQIPAEMEVIRSDIIVSGMAFDDDGIKELFWRLDDSDWSRLDGSNGFAVPFKLLDLADNEHVFQAYAVDLNGVAGDIVSRNFRVSREEPVGTLEAPAVELTNRGVITLSGKASDANDIASVSVSFDNGATFNLAEGTRAWSYELDTKTLPDGVHGIYIRLIDRYGTPGLAAGLISVDNTPPLIKLDTPADGHEGVATLTVGGRVSDSMAIQSTRLLISRLGASEPEMVVDIKADGVFSKDIDIRSLKPGWYNIQALALDRAGNSAYDSRNIKVLESLKADYAEILFPAPGETVSGRFTLDGRVVSAEPIAKASITVDGQVFAVVELGPSGWFSLPVEPGSIKDGSVSFRVETVSASGAAIASSERSIDYSALGPWVDIDAISTGDFIVGRPFLVGKAGWDSPPADPADREAVAARARLVASRRPVKVEVSRDNGKTWQKATGSAAFKFRLETQEYQNGALRLLVKASFANGETAVRKRLVVLDTKKPEISILKPSENGRYNGVISIEGTASDDNGLSKVSVLLRSGDKTSYEVPGFIQGSYSDVHLMGATRAELGLGLSFFDDNVKLQVALGQGFDQTPSWGNIFGFETPDSKPADRSRFRGYVLGARLLANLAYLPFSYWFGPDWDFFSMSFTLGASFTYFSMRDSLADILAPPDGRYMILSGIVGQWEFAKFTFDSTFFKSVGLYLEGGVVFIPSEASTKLLEFIRPNVAMGVRIGLF